MDTSKVTRVEVIDHQSNSLVGRAYVKHGCEVVSLSLQDEGRTLKIFISSKNDKPSCEHKRTESPNYTGGNDDLNITVTFKDKEGNFGVLKPDSLSSMEVETKKASQVAKIMSDLFKAINPQK